MSMLMSSFLEYFFIATSSKMFLLIYHIPVELASIVLINDMGICNSQFVIVFFPR